MPKSSGGVRTSMSGVVRLSELWREWANLVRFSESLRITPDACLGADEV